MENGSKVGRFLPFGGWLDIMITGLKLIPVGNKLMIYRRGKGKRFIGRTREAANFVLNVRLVCYEFSKQLKLDPQYCKLEIPITGRECPIRVDILFLFDKSESSSMIRSDIDNLTKGVYDGLKVGDLVGGKQFGLIDDDRYITAMHVEKGEAPDDGIGSRIFIRISRSGFRNDFDMKYLIGNALFPIPPYDSKSQGLSAKDKKIITPGDGRFKPSPFNPFAKKH